MQDRQEKGTGKRPFKHAIAIASVVASLGASLGVNVGELFATDPYADPCMNVKEMDTLQYNLITQAKQLREQQNMLFNEINYASSRPGPYPLSQFTVLKTKVMTLARQIKLAVENDRKVTSRLPIDEIVLQDLMSRARAMKAGESNLSPQFKELSVNEDRQILLLNQIKVDQTK